MRIEVSVEHRRMCGWRRPDKTGVGIYLVGPMAAEICERLPYYVKPCHGCGSVFRFFRGWMGVGPSERFSDEPRCGQNGLQENHRHELCAVCSPEIAGPNAMVVFVGKKFYSPAEFVDEALKIGISKKIPNFPEWFEIGKTYVYLAHNEAVLKQRVNPGTMEPVFDEKTKRPVMDALPGLIGCFRPVQIDLVVKNERAVPERAKRYAERFGDEYCRIVRVVPAKGEQTSMEGESND